MLQAATHTIHVTQGSNSSYQHSHQHTDPPVNDIMYSKRISNIIIYADRQIEIDHNLKSSARSLLFWSDKTWKGAQVDKLSNFNKGDSNMMTKVTYLTK